MPLKDVFVLVGLLMIAAGCYLISLPLALIVVGTILMATGVVAHLWSLRG